MNPEVLIPALGILTSIIVPASVFIWLYFEGKDKNKTILEISQNIDDPTKMEKCSKTTKSKFNNFRLSLMLFFPLRIWNTVDFLTALFLA